MFNVAGIQRRENSITAQRSSHRPSNHPGMGCPASTAEALERALSVAEFCAVNASTVDQTGAFPVAEFQKIVDAGLLALPLQPSLGGLGFGIDANTTYATLLLLKHLGKGNLAVGRVYEGHVNALQLIQTFGSSEQISAYASDARDRHKIFGVWNAEAADGVTLISPKEGLSPKEGRYQLTGCKTFCSGAGYVERPFVNGRLSDGQWQMCVVPMDQVDTAADPAWWQPSGMKATASYKVDFSGVELDSSSLIGKPGDYERQPWLTAGVVRFAAVQLGGAEALFDATRQYLQLLNRTSDPYQQTRLGQMAIAIESGRLWLQGAADAIVQYAPLFGGCPASPSLDFEQLVAYANMVRTAIEQICIDVIQLCERSVGTRGLLPPHPMERIIRDLTLYLRQPMFDAAIATVGQYTLAQSQSAHTLWSNHVSES